MTTIRRDLESTTGGNTMQSNASLGGRRSRLPGRVIAAITAAIAMVAGLTVAIVLPANAAPPAAKTIVSLTFDDGHASQQVAFDTMKQYGMVGTFYMNSGFVGAAGFLSLDQIRAIAAYGNEIASHSVSHADLATVTADEAARQICNDRVNWGTWGLPVSNFAYPFASSTTEVEALVQNCGDNSGRGLGDIKSPFSCPDCAVAETIPPTNPYFTKAPDQVELSWTLDNLKTTVTQAEATGGWVQLTFHDLCAGCPEPNISPEVFQQFIAWLAPRATRGTVVERVQEVIGGTVAPAVAGPVATEAAAGVNAIKNPSLETFDAATGLPQCFAQVAYGTNTPTWQTTTDAHTGTSAVTMAVTGYGDGAARLMPTLDLGECAPTVTAGKTYNLSTWYKSDVATQFDLYYRTALGTWAYWTSSPWFAAASTYTEATYTTPAVPVGATAISFGLNLFQNGTLTVDDLSMINGEATAPAALRSATSVNAAIVAEGDAPLTADDTPKEKGDVVTEHYEIPAPVATPEVPSIDNPGPHTFVLTPERMRGYGPRKPLAGPALAGGPVSVPAARRLSRYLEPAMNQPPVDWDLS
jgi:peptidoglycan/xylan/chitin deacetylase (PgdA/CDA1 family)